MAKKVAAKFVATIELNPEKAGGWLAIVSVQKEAGTSINSIQPAEGISEYSSWKNASAAKRWVKTMVLKHTPRKSVKMAITKANKETGKPESLAGVLEYKVDAS